MVKLARANTIADLRGVFCACAQWTDRGLAEGEWTKRWLVVQQLVNHATGMNNK